MVVGGDGASADHEDDCLGLFGDVCVPVSTVPTGQGGNDTGENKTQQERQANTTTRQP